MFHNKKAPILTATTCRKMEMLRQALEVGSGTRISFVHLDLNTGDARISYGEVVKDVTFSFRGSDEISWCSEDPWYDWYTAIFIDGVVKVSEVDPPHKVQTVAGECSLQWAGRSMNDRWEEPLLLDTWKKLAEERGLTLQQLVFPEAAK